MPVRIERHIENGQELAQWLEASDRVEEVIYPGLASNVENEKAKKYFDHAGGCGVISFELKGSFEQAVQVLDTLKVGRIATHVADARTCVLHPASTTHRQLSDEQRAASGVTPTLVRVSVGIEDIKDIIADFDAAFKEVFA